MVKELTHTFLVEDALKKRDDFMSVQDLINAGCGTKTQVIMTLIWLRRKKVVDVVINPSGESWWFLLPPEMDNRIRNIQERKMETKKRKKSHRRRTGIILITPHGEVAETVVDIINCEEDIQGVDIVTFKCTCGQEHKSRRYRVH